MTRRVMLSQMAALLLLLLTYGAAHSAGQGSKTQFSEAELYLELNDTDGDLGIHASIDGGPWTELEVEGPGDRVLLSILSRDAMRQQGLTQLFFESAEPPFDELAPEDFFLRFPEGRYEIAGRMQDGREMKAIARLSHILAAPPANVTVSGIPAAENCDADLPVVSAPVTIAWDPVMASHPDLGRSGPVTVSRYELFVERDGVKLSLELPPSVTAFEVPPAVTALGTDFKFEIIVRTTTGNNTAVESCFVME